MTSLPSKPWSPRRAPSPIARWCASASTASIRRISGTGRCCCIRFRCARPSARRARLAAVILLLLTAAFADPEIHRVATDDGADIVLEHLPTIGGPAVVLVHGISSNHLFWDLEPQRSLAQHLQRQGYDVWNLDLRGHGTAFR